MNIYDELKWSNLRALCVSACAKMGIDAYRFPILRAQNAGEAIKAIEDADPIERSERAGVTTYRITGVIDSMFGANLYTIGKDLEAMDSGSVKLVIDSPGGSPLEAMSFYNDAMNAKENGVEITTEVRGLAASAAMAPFLAGEQRAMREGSSLMIHDPWIATFFQGNAQELRDTMDSNLRALEHTTAIWRDLHIAHSSLSRAEVIMAMEKETFYTADESVEAGFATTKIGGSKTPNERAEGKDEMNKLDKEKMDNLLRGAAHFIGDANDG